MSDTTFESFISRIPDADGTLYNDDDDDEYDDYDDDYEDDYEAEPTCDICGRPEWKESPHYVSEADRVDDWNGQTGNHKSCDYRQIIEEVVGG